MNKHGFKATMQYTSSLQPLQSELHTLAELGGITTHPQVFRIIVELLSLHVPPAAIYSLLREAILKNRVQKDSASSRSSRASRTSTASDKGGQKM